MLKFNAWYELLEKSEGGPVWWYSTAAERKPSFSSDQSGESSGTHSEQETSLMRFSSPDVPGNLLYHWTGLLELYGAMVDIRHVLHDMSHEKCLDMLAPDSVSRTLDPNRQSKVALRIAQTGLELSSTLEGCSMAYVPVTLAEKYFRELLLTDLHGNNGEMTSSPGTRRQEIAKIGLECSKRAFDRIQRTVQNAQQMDLSAQSGT